MKSSSARPHTDEFRLGRFRATRVGIQRISLRDPYFFALTASWPRFIASALSLYLGIVTLFAFAYHLDDKAINGAQPGSLVDAFFFSLQTLTTVGYGAMSPGSAYGHLISGIELITGIFVVALLTGFFFVRFSRPRTHIVFSRVIVIADMDGVPTLSVRLANLRASLVVESQARILLVRRHITAEGLRLTRNIDLKLERSHNPVLVGAWNLLHRIDETSPIFGLTADDIEQNDIRFIATVSGFDTTSSTTAHAMADYFAGDLRFNHRFVDTTWQTDTGSAVMDLTRLHDTVPVEQIA